MAAPQPAGPLARGWRGRSAGSAEDPRVRRLRRGRLGETGAAVVFGLVLLGLWQLVGSRVQPILLSSPAAVAVEAAKLIGDGTLAAAFASSLEAFVPGYLLAVAVGVPVGLVVGRYRLAEAAAGPYVTAGYTTPLVALLPLFIVWFGIGFAAKVAIVFTLTVFQVIINTWRGVQAVPKSLKEVGSAFGLSQPQIMWKIIVPGTLPHIMTGLRLGVGRAIIGIVVAEFFTAVGGLGGIIINAGNSFDTARMFVPIILILLWGVVLTWLVGIVERRLASWHLAMTGR
jgi:ABC-type nitrate/sulfonate/bicarbonate transport system permease component